MLNGKVGLQRKTAACSQARWEPDFIQTCKMCYHGSITGQDPWLSLTLRILEIPTFGHLRLLPVASGFLLLSRGLRLSFPHKLPGPSSLGLVPTEVISVVQDENDAFLFCAVVCPCSTPVQCPVLCSSEGMGLVPSCKLRILFQLAKP